MSRRRSEVQALSTGAKSRKDDRANSQFQIGSGCDNTGVIATQFEQAAAQPMSDEFGDAAAHGSAARGRDQWNAAVASEDITGICSSHHHGADSLRDFRHLPGCLLQQDMAGDGCQWGVFRRFPDQRVAADKCQRGVPCPHRCGKVERGNHSHWSQRMPLFLHPMLWSLRSNDQTMQLTAEPDSEVTDVDHFLHFANRFRQNLAAFQSDQLCQFLLVTSQQQSKPPQQFPRTAGTSFHLWNADSAAAMAESASVAVAAGNCASVLPSIGERTVKTGPCPGCPIAPGHTACGAACRSERKPGRADMCEISGAE